MREAGMPIARARALAVLVGARSRTMQKQVVQPRLLAVQAGCGAKTVVGQWCDPCLPHYRW